MPSVRDVVRGPLLRLGAALVQRGAPPRWLGYRWVRSETVREHLGRTGTGRYETVHEEATAHNPLPRNVTDREALPADRGWWGYSFRDVPERASGETFLATLQGARVVPYVDPDGEFWVGLLTADDRALDLREVHFRVGHAARMRTARAPRRLRRATWVVERVYHNHSHWLTAHLPKLLLLRDRDALADAYLPAPLPPALAASLRLYGMDPDAFPTFDPAEVLEVDELTVLGTDRFRPELLRLVRERCPIPPAPRPDRRVYVSRAKAPRRRLLNEAEVWPLFEREGFERVFMEDLPLEAQVRLMRETAVLAAPHGAGLTNMLFCPEGTHVVEIADLSFPNPNFYAVAAAMGHPYWLVEAEPVGAGHPLERDLRVRPEAVAEVLAALPPPR